MCAVARSFSVVVNLAATHSICLYATKIVSTLSSGSTENAAFMTAALYRGLRAGAVRTEVDMFE